MVRMLITVGISDFKVSRNPADVLITYALGSCVGVALYDRQRRIGGLGHFMLPLAGNLPERAAREPDMFVDTGFPRLLAKVLEDGGKPRDLTVKIAGGANMLEGTRTEDRFRIGERNVTVLRKLCWKHGIFIAATEVGGRISRTMLLHLEDGRVILKTGGEQWELGHGL